MGKEKMTVLRMIMKLMKDMYKYMLTQTQTMPPTTTEPLPCTSFEFADGVKARLRAVQPSTHFSRKVAAPWRGADLCAQDAP